MNKINEMLNPQNRNILSNAINNDILPMSMYLAKQKSINKLPKKLPIKSPTNPTEIKHHPTATIMKRSQVPGLPTSMKPKHLTNSMKKYYNKESLDINVLVYEAMQPLDKKNDTPDIKSINAEMLKKRKTISGQTTKDIVKRTVHKPKPAIPVRANTWSSK